MSLRPRPDLPQLQTHKPRNPQTSPPGQRTRQLDLDTAKAADILFQSVPAHAAPSQSKAPLSVEDTSCSDPTLGGLPGCSLSSLPRPILQKVHPPPASPLHWAASITRTPVLPLRLPSRSFCRTTALCSPHYTQDKTQSPYGRPQAPRNLAPATTLTSPTPIRMTRPPEPFCHSSHHTVSFAYTFHFPAIPSLSSFGSLGGEACLPGHTHPPTACASSSHTFVHGVSLFVFLHVPVCCPWRGQRPCVLSSDVTAEPGT